MSTQVNDLNPKNAIYNAYKAKVKDIISRKATDLYKDKDFADEYKAVYMVTSLLRGVGNLLSSATFTIAVYLALNLIIPKGYSLVLALVSSVLFEVLKNKIWAITSKTVLKYKRVSIVAICILLGLHLVSIGGSIFGAWQLTNLLPQEQPSKAPVIDLDSINHSYNKQIATLDAQILALEQKNDWNSRVSIKEVIKQKTSLLNGQRTDCKQANEANVQTLKEHKENEIKRRKIKRSNRSNIRKACVIVTAFFELAFILCSLFIAYYLFRRHIDDTYGTTEEKASVQEASVQDFNNGQTTDGHKAPVIENKRTIVQGFIKKEASVQESTSTKGKELDYTRICQYSGCKKPFIHSIHNQKYCSTDCRKAAYMERKLN